MCDLEPFSEIQSHINLECIKKKHPSFTAAQIECPPDMYATLSEAHHKLLREAIGYAVD